MMNSKNIEHAKVVIDRFKALPVINAECDGEDNELYFYYSSKWNQYCPAIKVSISKLEIESNKRLFVQIESNTPEGTFTGTKFISSKKEFYELLSLVHHDKNAKMDSIQLAFYREYKAYANSKYRIEGSYTDEEADAIIDMLFD